MSNIVKIILTVAFAIFMVGFIWAIVVAVKRPNEIVKKPADKKVEQVTSSPAPTPQVSPSNSVPTVSSKPNPPKRRPSKPTRRLTVTTTTETFTTAREEVRVSADSNTWAASGVDQYGNAYAEAHAN